MPLRVLIVEDELLLALDLEDILLDAGYAVVGNAVDMHQAVALIVLTQGIMQAWRLSPVSEVIMSDVAPVSR